MVQERVERCVVELVWLPRVSNRHVGVVIFGLPAQLQTCHYEVILVGKAQAPGWRVDAVWPQKDAPVGLSPSGRMDLKDLIDTALRTKLPNLEIKNWSSTLIAE